MASAFHGSDLTKQLPYQKGCKRGMTIRQLMDSGGSCFDLSAGQMKILELLNMKNEFRDVISVSYPGYTTWKHFEHGHHRAPGTDMDFVVLNGAGEVVAHPALFRAFLWLASAEARAAGFVGGVGIGVLLADTHLHVDARHSSTLRWIETLQYDEVNPQRGIIVEGSPEWSTFYQIAKNSYGWNSDAPAVSEFVPGSSGWPLLPLALGAAGGAFGLTKDYLHAAAYGAGGLAIGYVVNAILRKIGVDMEK